MKSLKSILVAVALCLSVMGFAANVITNDEGVQSTPGDGNTRPLDLSLEKSVCRSGSNS